MSTTHLNDSTYADDGHRRHGGGTLDGGPDGLDGLGGPGGPGGLGGPGGSSGSVGFGDLGGHTAPDRSGELSGYGHPGRSARTGPGSQPRPVPRRGPADPVRALMHQHRELCERAVDPLEIAAGLEAHGVTDRTAARFRHRDVFSLADELYARVPRDQEPPRTHGQPTLTPARGLSTGPLLLSLVPGVLAVLTVTGREAFDGAARAALTAAGALAVAAAVIAVLGRGPLRARGRTVRAGCLWTSWLIGFAVWGEDLLGQISGGGPEGPLHPATAPLAGLALAVAPAAWCARLFAVRARRRRDGSRGLAEFASGARPLLLGTVALYAGALTILLVLAGALLPQGPAGGALAPAVALGLLLFLARLLAVYGFARAAATGLAAACAAEALAPLLLLAGRLPGCSFLARPVETAMGAWGAGAVPALACALAGAALLVRATAALSRASAHTD
ncbi:hypothetical protein ACIBCM_11215 [Streptomyces sp. NPDC051018]|uniref:hypothetical protein n=1 Tax=Streptomyces sp. NPDC051018 TaxID=3365639 RepID=UPI0037B81E06